jgi:hypothetical protein
LLEPGRGIDKQQLVTTLERALNFTRPFAQRHPRCSRNSAESDFQSIRLGGDIDLLLTDSAGREIVLDVKWGREPYRAKSWRQSPSAACDAFRKTPVRRRISVFHRQQPLLARYQRLSKRRDARQR